MSDFDLPGMRAKHWAMLPVERMVHEEHRMILELFRDVNEFTGGASIRCESRHNLPNNLTCTTEVTHLWFSCIAPADGRPVCMGHVQAHMAAIDRGVRCRDCKAPAEDCWDWRMV